jgi:histidine triad (HIT) family protein
MQDSVFTKIIKGEIPCHKVYEDDRTLAFMDIHPIVPGHVLVVPKNQVDHIDDLPETDYIALFESVKKVASRVKEVLGTERAILLVMGYDVPHAHVHVLPSSSGEEFYSAIGRVKEAASSEPDHQKLTAMAERIAFI